MDFAGTPLSVRVAAPAKLNPALEVLARRADGFHELDLWMTTIDLVDELEVRRLEDGEWGGAQERDGLSLEVGELLPGAAEGCPSDEGNLVWRAAQLVRARARELGRRPAGIGLRLLKRIPSEAGLGGGSADAAAALLGTARVLGLDPDDEVLARGLAQLGSDCLFFLKARDRGAARCGGRGERIEPLELPPRRPWVVLLTPAARSSTAAVFGALDEHALAPDGKLPSLDALLGLDAIPTNRLEPAALETVEELWAWRSLLDEVAAGGARGARGGTFHLCGSGSSFFALTPDRDSAESLLARVTAAGKARDYGLRHAAVHTFRGRGVELL